MTGRLHVALVFCYEGKRAFTEAELHGQSGVVSAISKDIECDAFVAWQRGKSAEKLKDMALIDQVREETKREREVDIARNDAWKLAEREERRTFEQAIQRRHDDLKQQTDCQHKETIEWQKEADRRMDERQGRSLLIQFLLAMLAALVALIAAKMIPWFH